MINEDYHKSTVGEDGEVPVDAPGSPPQTEMGSFLYSGPSGCDSSVTSCQGKIGNHRTLTQASTTLTFTRIEHVG